MTKFQRRIDYMVKHHKSFFLSQSIDTDDSFEVKPFMVINKVFSSQVKKIKFPIISINELEQILTNYK